MHISLVNPLQAAFVSIASNVVNIEKVVSTCDWFISLELLERLLRFHVAKTLSVTHKFPLLLLTKDQTVPEQTSWKQACLQSGKKHSQFLQKHLQFACF